MKRVILLGTIALGLLSGCKEKETRDNSLDINIRVDKIWDNGKYCAFTSLTEFNGKYYVAFREGEGHVFDKNGVAAGEVRVICSEDGDKWESVACLKKEGYDLRDPKICVTSDNRLMIVIGGSIYAPDRSCVGRHTQVSFSSDGINFTAPEEMNVDSGINTGFDWLWRVSWHGDTGYGVIRSNTAPDGVSVEDALRLGYPRQSDIALVKTKDGVNYDLVSKLDIPGELYPNETVVKFLPDGRMAMLVRTNDNGLWGVSEAPYTDWEFSDFKMKVGGQDMIALSDDKIIICTRAYVPTVKTTILKAGIDGQFEQVCVLPGKGDCSYPGMLVVGDELWVSYYACVDTNVPDIYLARMPISLFD